MRSIGNISRTLTALLAASLLLAAAVGGASARNLSFSSQTIRATWNRLEWATETVTITCQVTMEGSFHTRTLAKVAGALIGAVTRALVKEGSCAGGTATPKNLPWHITYESFTGTLPNITSIHPLISRFRFEITQPGVCTGDYGTETDNITGSASLEAGGAITGVEPVAGRSVSHRVSGTGLCPTEGRFIGPGTFSVLNSTARVTVTLI